MIGIAIAWMLLSGTVLLLSIAAHELAHAYWYYKITGKKVKIHFSLKRVSVGKDKDYERLSDSEYGEVIWAGIIIGAANLALLCSFLISSGYLTLILFILYTYGCKGDIGKLMQITKVN